MPPSNPMRHWHPQLVHHLRAHWRPDQPLSYLPTLTSDLNALLETIRRDPKAKLPRIKCPCCGKHDLRILFTVRGVIDALYRYQLADLDTVTSLQCAWATHQRKAHLDDFGAPKREPSNPPPRPRVLHLHPLPLQ